MPDAMPAKGQVV